jgi:DNA-binding GntR family transcriptional regulator
MAAQSSSAVQRVADQVRQWVFDGVLGHGVALREVAVAEKLNVGRSTVREALGLLVSEGILERVPHRGVTVAIPTRQTVTDVMRAREVLEVAGAEHWSQASKPAQNRLQDAVARYVAAAADQGSFQELNEAHVAVHLAIVGLTESPKLEAMAENLMKELRVALAATDRVRADAHSQAHSHKHLLELLESADFGRMRAELLAHLADASSALIDALRQLEQE